MRVRDVLDVFPLLLLRAGEAGLDQTVRWVHVIDQPDMAPWLREGTFVLTTGISWGTRPEAYRARVRQLVDGGASGLLVAVGRFFPEVPPTAIEEADKHGLPLVEAPFSLPFIDITDQVHRRLVGEQYRILEQSDLIHRTLTETALHAGNLGQITQRLSELLGCASAVYGCDHLTKETMLLASSGHMMEPGPVLAMVRRVVESGAAITDVVDGHQVLSVPVRSGGSRVLLLFAPEGGFGLLEHAVAGHASTVIALHLAHQRELAEVERRVNASFVDAIITGAYRDGDPLVLERARMRGIDPEGAFRVVIARIGRGPALSTLEEFELRQALLRAVEANLAALSQPEVTTFSLNRVLLLWRSGEHDRENLNRLKRGVVAQLGLPVDLACSSPVLGLQAVQRVTVEAERMIDAGLASTDALLYEDQVLLRLIGHGDGETQREIWEAVVGRLAKSRNGDELIATAEALVECGYSQVEAAKCLHVHRNTMQKRCARIESILGRSLRSPETQTLIYLSLAVSRQKKGEPQAAGRAKMHT